MALEQLERLIREQQGKPGTPERAIGEQLLDMARREPQSAALLEQDLAGAGMRLCDAAKKLKEYADKNRGKENVFCVTPDAAEKVLRKFYGLPEAAEAAPQPTAPAREAGAPAIRLEDFI